MQTALILSAALLGIWLSFGSLSAVATYSRVLAAQMYGPHRPYGYVYGGSGGAFKTLRACRKITFTILLQPSWAEFGRPECNSIGDFDHELSD
jgi:hypothetical protein